MVRNYSSTIYKKPTRAGRKPLPKGQHRKTISVRVAPDTYQYLVKHGLKAGREIDRLVKMTIAQTADDAAFKNVQDQLSELEGAQEQSAIAEAEARDTITETARGLLALIVERGTSHLNQDQIEMLDDNFSLLINNFLLTFKHKA
jgi:hypothetical protein